MALTALQTYYVRKNGVETSGGGFDPSQTAGMLTDGAATNADTASPVVTSASYNFVAGDAGKWLYIASGTNWLPGYYLIASVAANAATLSVACATVASPTGATFTMNYADQDAPELSLTDLASTASTTVTSAVALFTKVMVGNMIRLASASGTPVADSAGSRYLTITAFTDTSNVVVDKTSGTYTAGVAKVGGAYALLRNLSNGGTLTAPALTSPLAAGHTVYVRSAGSAANPAIGGTPDYDYSAGYYQFIAGSTTVGRIRFIGMGASEAVPAAGVIPAYRPLVKIDGLLFWGVQAAKYWDVINFKSFHETTPGFTEYGIIAGAISSSWQYSIHDTNGLDVTVVFGKTSGGINANYMKCNNCWICNTGSTTAGTLVAIPIANSTQIVQDCLITDVRGTAIETFASGAATYVIKGNVINSPRLHGIVLASLSADYGSICENNTVYNPTGDAFRIAQSALTATIKNNNASKIPTGTAFAYRLTAGTAAVNDAIKYFFDYNNAYLDGGSGGLYSGISAGPHDTNLDPQFTNPATNDFSIGTNLKAKGFGITPLISGQTTSYVDIGGAQRQETGGLVAARTLIQNIGTY